VTARESIENLWDRATPVAPLLTAYRAEIISDNAKWLDSVGEPDAATLLRAVAADLNGATRAAVPAGQAPATDRAPLRTRIAEALAREDAHNWGYDHGFVHVYGGDPETDGFVDAVLAVLPASVDRAAVLRESATRYEAMLAAADTGSDPRYWTAVRDVADGLRHMAAEAPVADGEAVGEAWRPDGEPTESTHYQVVGDWGVEDADDEEEARAAVGAWLADHPQSGAHAEQRIVREWPDGSEFYGPWTDLPEQPAAGAQQTGEARS
jgi:hypothetical protein